MQWCCNVVIKLLAYPLGLCLFLKAIMPYTAEQQLVNFRLTVKPRFNEQMRTNDSPLLEKVR